MKVPTREDIERAARIIDGRVRSTPVIDVTLPDGVTVTLKLELLQHTGSFKPRGAFHSVLSAARRPETLVAASGGNHGLAAAHVGRELGIPARIFVPETAPRTKVDRLRGLGADVTLIGQRYSDAFAASQNAAARPGALAVHAYDGWATVAGQGTVGRELEQQADVDTVLVAVGGGGLLGGIAAWTGTSTRLVGVEPTTANALHAALASGEPVDTIPGGIAADALGATRVGAVGFAAMVAAGVRSVLVDDADILTAREWLWRTCRVVSEAGGATALAALLSGAYRPEPGERVGVVVCGANTDPSDLPLD
jgi:threonine dehydratase